MHTELNLVNFDDVGNFSRHSLVTLSAVLKEASKKDPSSEFSILFFRHLKSKEAEEHK
jgi:hypothetical protein